MKTVEVVAALANLTEEQVEAVVNAVNHSRNLNAALANLEPAKKRRGRKPGTKNKPKAAAAPKPKPAPKKAAKKSKAAIPDKFEE